MFTGIIQQIGRVVSLRRLGGEADLVVYPAQQMPGLVRGESICVNGACLTVEHARGGQIHFSLTPETLAATNLGGLKPGDRVNLERALTLADRLGGHLVAGHVDGVGTVASARRQGESAVIEIACPLELARYLAPKGSVAVDGVSLTVVELEGQRFRVSLVRHTLGETTLGELRVGNRVNIEVDLLARYLERLLSGTGVSPVGHGQDAHATGGLSMEALAELETEDG